jgi:hypothetical protein
MASSLERLAVISSWILSRRAVAVVSPTGGVAPAGGSSSCAHGGLTAMKLASMKTTRKRRILVGAAMVTGFRRRAQPTGLLGVKAKPEESPRNRDHSIREPAERQSLARLLLTEEN